MAARLTATRINRGGNAGSRKRRYHHVEWNVRDVAREDGDDEDDPHHHGRPVGVSPPGFERAALKKKWCGPPGGSPGCASRRASAGIEQDSEPRCSGCTRASCDRMDWRAASHTGCCSAIRGEAERGRGGGEQPCPLDSGPSTVGLHRRPQQEGRERPPRIRVRPVRSAIPTAARRNRGRSGRREQQDNASAHQAVTGTSLMGCRSWKQDRSSMPTALQDKPTRRLQAGIPSDVHQTASPPRRGTTRKMASRPPSR